MALKIPPLLTVTAVLLPAPSSLPYWLRVPSISKVLLPMVTVTPFWMLSVTPVGIDVRVLAMLALPEIMVRTPASASSMVTASPESVTFPLNSSKTMAISSAPRFWASAAPKTTLPVMEAPVAVESTEPPVILSSASESTTKTPLDMVRPPETVSVVPLERVTSSLTVRALAVRAIPLSS